MEHNKKPSSANKSAASVKSTHDGGKTTVFKPKKAIAQGKKGLGGHRLPKGPDFVIQNVMMNGQEMTVKMYQPLYASPISLQISSKDGLPASAAIDFINLSGFTQVEFKTTFKTTVKTIQTYVTQELKLDSVLSEKLLKAFALFEKGTGVFGSPQAFHDWLNKPAFGLGGQLPYDLMDTITGIMLIEEELIRLEYGDLA